MAELETAPEESTCELAPELRRHAARPLGVYVHFPWCLVKCPYCDFVAHRRSPDRIEHRRYADAVLAELATRLARLDVAKWGLTSVFFGGGTPSLWDRRELARVLRAVLDAFRTWPSVRPHPRPETPQCAAQRPPSARRDAETTLSEAWSQVEVSVECDPVGFDVDAARELLDAGVGRVSLGVQSFDDARLRFLGRAHDGRQALQAIEAAVRAGVPRVAVDLIHAVAGLSPELAARDAVQALDLGATHISAYGLTIESATVFGKLARQGRLPLVDDQIAVDSFYAIDETLTGRGLEHYEISNHAVPGHRSIHNAGYWMGHEYLGLGTGAAGMLDVPQTGPIRYRNVPHPQRYLDAVAAAAQESPGAPSWSGIAEECETLDPVTRLRERIMLGLRLAEGLDLVQAAAACGATAWTAERRKSVQLLEQQGRLVCEGDRLRIPKHAWRWADATSAALF